MKIKILDEYQKTGVRVNRDTYYLNYFIKCAHEGIFPGLNNAKLRSFGKLQKLYPGTLEFSGKQKTCSEMMRVIRNMIFR